MQKKLTGPIIMVGSPSEYPDIGYATGFRAPDPVVLLVQGKKKDLVVSSLEYGRARKETVGVNVHTPESLGIPRVQRRRIGNWAMALLRENTIRRVKVPPYFPVAVADKIRKAGIKVTISEGPIFTARAVKRPDEIARIKECQQTAVIATRAAINMIASSEIRHDHGLKLDGKILTSERVQRVINRVLVDHECMCTDAIVAGGTQSADPHLRGKGQLYAHEPIVIDIFPQHMTHGYWGDITRTVCRGTASAPLKKMYRAVKNAQDKALKAVKPGVQCSTVHKAAAGAMEKSGYSTELNGDIPEGFIHSTGHGVGLAIHEEPSVSFNKVRLKAGNIITIEPGLYYQATGGIRIEDTVVVTRSGWQYLAPCEKKFEI